MAVCLIHAGPRKKIKGVKDAESTCFVPCEKVLRRRKFGSVGRDWGVVCCSGRHWAKLVPRAAFLSRVGDQGAAVY